MGPDRCDWRILVFADFRRMPVEASKAYINWNSETDDPRVGWVGYKACGPEDECDFLLGEKGIRFDGRFYDRSISQLEGDEWELILPRAKAIVYSIGSGVKKARVIDLGPHSGAMVKTLKMMKRKCEDWSRNFDRDNPTEPYITTKGDWLFLADPNLVGPVLELMFSF